MPRYYDISNKKMAASLPIPKSVYFIRTRPENNVMSCLHNGKQYLVGFMFEKQAKYVVPKVSVSSKIVFDDMSKDLSVINIQKKININKMPCYVQEKEFVEVMSMPWTSNIGVAFTYDLFEEDENKMLFETQIIHPCDDPLVYAHHAFLDL